MLFMQYYLLQTMYRQYLDHSLPNLQEIIAEFKVNVMSP